MVRAMPAGVPIMEPTMNAHSSDEGQIKLLQEQWMQAWIDQDLESIERILAPEFMLVVSSMPDKPVTRAQWIAMLPRYTARSFDYDNMLVRLFGQTAVTSSLGTAGGAQVDGADRSQTFFLTDVWRKRGGHWQVVSRHSSLPEPGSQSVDALASR
jgi:ketosteroid isomerase-like protein